MQSNDAVYSVKIWWLWFIPSFNPPHFPLLPLYLHDELTSSLIYFYFLKYYEVCAIKLSLREKNQGKTLGLLEYKITEIKVITE